MPDPVLSRPRPAPRRTAVAAVLGSVAALGGAGGAVAQSTGHLRPDRQRRESRQTDTLSAAERALLGRVFGALSAKAPAVAEPILARGVLDGTITEAQRAGFLARLASVGAPKPATGSGVPADPAPGPPSPAAQALFQRVFAAIQAELPVIGLPMLSAGVADGTITEAQANRLGARLHRGPRLGFGLVMRGARATGATRLP